MKRNLTAGLVFAALLSACGFESLYVQKQHNNLWYFSGKFDSSIATEMSQIKVEPIADRLGSRFATSCWICLLRRVRPRIQNTVCLWS